MKTLLSLLFVCSACLNLRAAIVLSDTFPYTNGVLTNASAGKWRHTTGGTDEVNVTNGLVELTRTETEDVASSLAVSYPASSGTTLYSRFTVYVLSPPNGASGNYFAHLDGTSARARVFVVTNGAAVGKFRLGLANGGTTASVNWAADLNTNQTYTVVTRHVINNATATLWVDPASDSDPSITAADVVSASSANAFAWRQDPGLGALLVDDLLVASSFGEALSGNEAPSISNIPDQQVAAGATGSGLGFLVGDAETTANFLVLTASVSDSNLISAALSGSGSNRTVQITAANLTGSATVTVSVFDGFNTSRDSFLVTVVPALLFADEFNYPDGALITNATPPWAHHSGTTTGQVQVVDGKMVLSTAFTEDVSVILPGGPYTTNFPTYLYASFLVNFSALPTGGGDYFAHFNTTSARCRIFANTNNAGPGTFRLGLLDSGQTVPVQLATNLSTNTSYRVVVKYSPRDGRARLVVNPASESDLDFGLGLTDSAAEVAVNAFAFREDPGIGTFTVDELRLGLTFAAVTAVAPALRIEPLAAGQARLAWTASATGYSLQSNTNLVTTNWQDVVATPVVTGSENVVTNNPASSPIFFRLKK